MFAKFAALLVAVMALFSVTNAQRALLQEGAAGAIPAMPQFPFYNPGQWISGLSNFYSQAIPYDMYANWVNQNTAFNLPIVGAGMPDISALLG